MKKEILSEVNRFREIMGLSLLSEGPLPKQLISDLVSAFAKKDVDELVNAVGTGEAAALRKVFDDVSDATGKDLASIIRGFKAGSLEGRVEDMFVAKLIQSGTDSLKQAAIKSYTKGNPKVIADVLVSIENVGKLANTMRGPEYNDYIAKVKNLIDSSALSPDMKKYLQTEFYTAATSSGLKSATDAALSSKKVFSELLDDTGNLNSDTTRQMNELAKGVKVDPADVISAAKTLIKENPNMTVIQLKTKLLQQQEELKKMMSKLSDVQREEVKKKYSFVKSFIGNPMNKLDTPKKSFYSVVSLGIMLAGLTGIGVGGYMIIDHFRVSKEEAQKIVKKISVECLLDDVTANKKIRLVNEGDDEILDEYVVNVYIDGKTTQVKDTEEGLKLNIEAVGGGKMALECGMLQDFPQRQQQQQQTNLTSMTRTQATSAITTMDSTITDIVLSPDKDGETKYTYTAKSDGVAISGDVKLDNGQIIVT